MPFSTAYFWSKAPFVRLLIALIAGIIIQWRIQFAFEFLATGFAITFLLILIYFFIPLKSKYRFSYFNGIAINFMIAVFGGSLVWMHDIRNDDKWIGHSYSDSSYVIVTIEEPLTEKTNSFKAQATINGIYSNN